MKPTMKEVVKVRARLMNSGYQCIIYESDAIGIADYRQSGHPYWRRLTLTEAQALVTAV